MGISITATADDIRQIAECTYEQAKQFNEIVDQYEEDTGTKILPEGWGYGDIRICLTVYKTIGSLVDNYSYGKKEELQEELEQSDLTLEQLGEQELNELINMEIVDLDQFIGWRVCEDGSVVLCDMSNH